MAALAGGGPERTRRPRTGDLLAGPEFRRVAVRYLPVVLVVAALVSGVSTVARFVGGPENTAVARVALTERVVWPYYDVVRERLVEEGNDPAFRARVAEDLTGGELLEIRIETPVNQAYVDVVARASSDAVSVEAANEAARLLVADVRQRLVGSLTGRITEAERELDRIEDSITSMTGQLNAPGLTSEEAALLEERREVEISRTAVHLEARDRARLELADAAVNEIEVLRTAIAAGDDTSGVARDSILIALFAALLAAFAAAYHNARSARIRSVTHALSGAARGLPVFAIGVSAETHDRQILAKQILEHRPAGLVLEVTTAPCGAIGTTLDDLAAGVHSVGGRVVTVGPQQSSAAGPTADLVQLLVVCQRRTTVINSQLGDTLGSSRGLHLTVTPAAAILGEAGLLPIVEGLSEQADLVVMDSGSALDAEAVRLPASDRRPRGVLVVGVLDRTRQSDLRAAIAAVSARGTPVTAVLLRPPSDPAPEPAAVPEEQPNASAEPDPDRLTAGSS